MSRRSLDKVYSQLAELESNIEHFHCITASVSTANIGWHIEHSFLVMNAVTQSLKASDPDKFKREINLKKLYIFAIGRFPRGKAKAPKLVIPRVELDQNRLLKHLDWTKNNLDGISKMNDGVFFKHHVFGNLRLSDTIHFLEIHTEHHLKIVREILTQANALADD